MTLRTLNYGNYGIFLIMGNAGFCPSTVGLSRCPEQELHFGSGIKALRLKTTRTLNRNLYAPKLTFRLRPVHHNVESVSPFGLGFKALGLLELGVCSALRDSFGGFRTEALAICGCGVVLEFRV